MNAHSIQSNLLFFFLLLLVSIYFLQSLSHSQRSQNRCNQFTKTEFMTFRNVFCSSQFNRKWSCKIRPFFSFWGITSVYHFYSHRNFRAIFIHRSLVTAHSKKQFMLTNWNNYKWVIIYNFCSLLHIFQ